MIADLEAEGR